MNPYAASRLINEDGVAEIPSQYRQCPWCGEATEVGFTFGDRAFFALPKVLKSIVLGEPLAIRPAESWLASLEVRRCLTYFCRECEYMIIDGSLQLSRRDLKNLARQYVQRNPSAG